MIKVLHVTECYGGGVGKAIDTFTELAPENVEHYLLYTGEENPQRNPNFKERVAYPQGLLRRLWKSRKEIARLQPDLIIAHSSWAGIYSRASQAFQKPVYQPHCYVIENKSVNPLLWRFYWLVEKMLTWNTKATIVLSNREKEISRALNPKMKTVMFPNVNSLGIDYHIKTDEELKELVRLKHKKPKIAMLGRIAPQKDPQWYAQVAKQLGADRFNFVWIGDGEDEYKQVLLEAGVEITGWKSAAEVYELLESSDIYLHTATYEGFPIAVLDAVALDVVTLVRDIPAFNGTPLTSLESPAAAAQMIRDLVEDEDTRIQLVKRQATLLSTMNQNTQKTAIGQVLDLATDID